MNTATQRKTEKRGPVKATPPKEVLHADLEFLRKAASKTPPHRDRPLGTTEHYVRSEKFLDDVFGPPIVRRAYYYIDRVADEAHAMIANHGPVLEKRARATWSALVRKVQQRLYTW